MRRKREGAASRELRILRARVENRRGLWSPEQIEKMRGMIADIERINPSLA